MSGPRTAEHTACPRCGATTLRDPNGLLLDPDPHPLAIHLPDGSRLDAVRAAAILTGRQPPAGHHLHAPSCNPAAPLTLF